jgi:hypothetical protein
MLALILAGMMLQQSPAILCAEPVSARGIGPDLYDDGVHVSVNYWYDVKFRVREVIEGTTRVRRVSARVAAHSKYAIFARGGFTLRLNNPTESKNLELLEDDPRCAKYRK